MKCPCKECMKFPICLNKTNLFCKDLYNFIVISNGSGFIKHHKEQMNYTGLLFKKKISATSFTNKLIKFGQESRYK